MRVLVAVVAALLALTLPGGAAVADPDVDPDVAPAPTVALDRTVVTSKTVTHRTEPVTVRVTLAGAAPFTWTSSLTTWHGHDHASITRLEGAGLPAGTSHITMSTTAAMDHPGRNPFTITVKDAAGRTATASTGIVVLGRTNRPTVAGVARHPRKRAQRVVWGRGSDELVAGRYRVYLRARGKRSYRLVGSGRQGPDGVWAVSSRTLRPGRLYVVFDSPYVPNRRSRIHTVTARALRAEVAASELPMVLGIQVTGSRASGR